MPNKLPTVLKRIDKLPKSQSEIIYEFKQYKEGKETSERELTNSLVIIELFARELKDKSLCDVEKQDILSFLDARRKTPEQDPDEKWKTTWNYYRNYIATFYNWYTNKDKDIDPDDWEMPPLVSTIKQKKTKRLSPYNPNDVWLEHELLCAVKYCANLRDKLAITLMWDMAGRNHEITKLKIKHIVFKEKYAIISIPWSSKTGERTNPAILSFPYLRDYLNDHPFAFDSDAFLILSEYSNRPIQPDNLRTIMLRLKDRIKKLLEQKKISDEDTETIRDLLRKPWNPYLVGRHSSITEKTDILLDHQLTSFAGWTVNTKRRATYAHRSGKQTRTPLLQHHGIESIEVKKPSRKECHNCNHINTAEASICSKCSVILNHVGFATMTKEEQAQQKTIEEQSKKIENQDKKLADMEEKMYKFMQMLPEAKTQ